MEYTDRQQNVTAVHRLRELSVLLDSDPEVIDAMSIEQVKSELAEMGLDPNKPVSMSLASAERDQSAVPVMLASTANDSQSIPRSTSRGSFEAVTRCERNEVALDYASISDPSEMERLGRTAAGSERLINEHSRLNEETARELRLEQLKLQIQQLEGRYAKHLREYDFVNCKSQLISSEFTYLALQHNRELPTLSGEFFARHEGDTEKARYYFVSAILTTAVAILLGVYFAVTALLPVSKFLVVLASTIIAASLVSVSGAILRLLTGANPENPEAIPKLKVAVVVFGGLFFVLLATFMSLRFGNIQRLGMILPVLMVGLEFSAIVLAGAFECFSRIYRWSFDLDKRIRHLLQRKTELELKIKQEVATLEDLQARVGSSKVHSHDQLNDFDLPTSTEQVHRAAVGYP